MSRRIQPDNIFYSLSSHKRQKSEMAMLLQKNQAKPMKWIVKFIHSHREINFWMREIRQLSVCFFFARLCVLITLEIIQINLSSTLRKREKQKQEEKKTLRWQPVYQESRDNRIVMNAIFFGARIETTIIWELDLPIWTIEWDIIKAEWNEMSIDLFKVKTINKLTIFAFVSFIES